MCDEYRQRNIAFSRYIQVHWSLKRRLVCGFNRNLEIYVQQHLLFILRPFYAIWWKINIWKKSFEKSGHYCFTGLYIIELCIKISEILNYAWVLINTGIKLIWWIFLFNFWPVFYIWVQNPKYRMVVDQVTAYWKVTFSINQL